MKKMILLFVFFISILGFKEVRSQDKPMAPPEILQKIMNWEGIGRQI
jgi:hypothetical protein